MGYPSDLLSTRALVKPGLYAVIPKNGLVNNVIPNIKNRKFYILCRWHIKHKNWRRRTYINSWWICFCTCWNRNIL